MTCRMRASLRDIGQYKKEHNMPVLQNPALRGLLARRADRPSRWVWTANSCAGTVLQAIHEESIRRQQMRCAGPVLTGGFLPEPLHGLNTPGGKQNLAMLRVLFDT